jgi:hypothetical protein
MVIMMVGSSKAVRIGKLGSGEMYGDFTVGSGGTGIGYRLSDHIPGPGLRLLPEGITFSVLGRQTSLARDSFSGLYIYQQDGELVKVLKIGNGQ